MTKKEAVKYFKEHIAPIIRNKYGNNDKVAMCEAWNDYTDALCKERSITPKQYDRWINPF